MLPCALIHTHAHSHTHIHTHHGQLVIHASTSMLCYCNLFYFLIVDPHTSIKLPLAVILFIPCFSFVFLLEPYLFLNCLVYQCDTHMHTNPHAHARTFMYTHRSHASITNMCICTHKNGFGSHPSHAHTHIQN